MTADKMSLDKMTADKMTRCLFLVTKLKRL